MSALLPVDASAPRLLRVEGLTKHFPVTRGVFGRVVGQVRAVDGVSFDVAPGETLGLVGESGCGKTTVGRTVLRLVEPTSGRVTFDGVDVTGASAAELTKLRRHLQIVFQDPVSSLNPRKRVVDIVGEALEVHGLATGPGVDRRVSELLDRVGLPPSWMNRYPHEFSGGQRQRIGIARAIALSPKLVICDEAVSALDVSIQAQVVNLLVGLQRDMGLSYLFIAHDLSVVRHVSHRIAVMYLGQIVEIGPAKRIFRAPGHPYTQALLSAIPVPSPERRRLRVVLEGDVPTPLNPPGGCRFHTRCPAVFERCPAEEPASVVVEEGHTVKCWHADGLAERADWHAILAERVESQTRKNSEKTATTASWPGPDAEAFLFPSRKQPARRVDAATRAEARQAWSRRWPLVAASVVLLLLLGLAVSHRAARKAAERQLESVRAEIQAQARVTGRLPETLDDLGFRLFPIFERGRPIDTWGHRIFYRAPGTEGRPSIWEAQAPMAYPARKTTSANLPKSAKLGSSGGLMQRTVTAGSMAVGFAALCACTLAGCKSDPAADGFAEAGANTNGGSSGNGGGSGSGATGGGGSEDLCPSMNFSTAPPECLQDWSHAADKYPDPCAAGALVEGGCQAKGNLCGLDAIFYFFGGSDSLYCHYDPATGNLVGFTSASRTPTCVSFDLDFPPSGYFTGTCD